jgi:hypothetical protein
MRSQFRRLAVPAAMLAGMTVLVADVGGQPPPAAPKSTTAKGQVKVGIHRFKMETGKMYKIRVEANGFTPHVTIRPGQFLQTGGGFSGGAVIGDSFEGFIIPTDTREYRVTVAPDVNDDELDGQLFDYSITVTPIPMAREPMLDVTAKTTPQDPMYRHPNGNGNRGPHKAYTVNFKAGEIYIVSMNMTKQGEFDPYLLIEGPGGKVMAENDDGGESVNSRIVYQPKRGGEHRIIATGLGNGSGGFNLKVITTAAGAAAAAGGKADGPRDPEK